MHLSLVRTFAFTLQSDLLLTQVHWSLLNFQDGWSGEIERERISVYPLVWECEIGWEEEKREEGGSSRERFQVNTCIGISSVVRVRPFSKPKDESNGHNSANIPCPSG